MIINYKDNFHMKEDKQIQNIKKNKKNWISQKGKEKQNIKEDKKNQNYKKKN